MGVVGRVSEERVDAVLEGLADHVLKPLRLVVDLLPGVPERLRQVGLEEPVVAQDLERQRAAGWGEGGAAVLGVAHQAEPCEFAEHAGDACGGYPEGAREFADLHLERVAVAEFEERLEVILHRARHRRAPFHGAPGGGVGLRRRRARASTPWRGPKRTARSNATPVALAIAPPIETSKRVATTKPSPLARRAMAIP